MEDENPIPKHFRNAKFIKLQRELLDGKWSGKKPLESDFNKTKNYSYDDKELHEHIKSGSNYGILMGGDDNLMALDCDNPFMVQIIEKKLPKTFRQHSHFIYRVTHGDNHKLNNGKNKDRCLDMISKGKFIVGAGSLHHSGTRYAVVDDVPIADLDIEQIAAVFPLDSDNILFDADSSNIEGFTVKNDALIKLFKIEPDDCVTYGKMHPNTLKMVWYYSLIKFPNEKRPRLRTFEIATKIPYPLYKRMIRDNNIKQAPISFRQQKLNDRRYVFTLLTNEKWFEQAYDPKYLTYLSKFFGNVFGKTLGNDLGSSGHSYKAIKHKDTVVGDIKQSLKIKELLQHYGSKVGGKEATCVLHDDEHPSLTFDESKNIWYCHACNLGGSVIDLVIQKESCDFKTALQKLEELYKLE